MNLSSAFDRRAGIFATAVLAATFAGCAGPPPSGHERLYGQFADDVKNGKVTSVRVKDKNVVTYTEGKESYYSYIPPGASVDNLVGGKVADYGSTRPEEPLPWLTLLPALAMLTMMGGWLWMQSRQMQAMSGGKTGMGFGKSRAKLNTEGDKKITLKDVAGCDEAKEQVGQIVKYLKDPKKYKDMDAEVPRGTLLVGPPGTGKTHLARAIAGEAGVPFYTISGSDFVEMFVGVGASRVRDMFAEAKKNAPCIIFIDEIDAVGRQRGAGLGGGHDEREQTLNQLLVELDGFDGIEGVILLAGTNRPDVLDPALLRPGRFGRRVVVGRPDMKGREEILKIYTRNKKLAPDVDLKVLARGTPGFTGADLKNLANEAALLAADLDKKIIDMGDFEHAKDTVVLGQKYTSRVMSPEERRLTAYHEAGHAVVTLHSPESDPIHKASILSRGNTGGVVWRLAQEDKGYTRLGQLKADMAVGCGGRIAEELTFNGNISTGASSDIAQVTKLAHSMVTEWAMGGKDLGFLRYASDQQEVFLGRSVTETKNMSEETARKVDMAMLDLANAAEATARDILTSYPEELERVAQALLEYEELTGEEVALVAAGKSIGREKGSVAFTRTVPPANPGTLTIPPPS